VLLYSTPRRDHPLGAQGSNCHARAGMKEISGLTDLGASTGHYPREVNAKHAKLAFVTFDGNMANKWKLNGLPFMVTLMGMASG